MRRCVLIFIVLVFAGSAFAEEACCPVSGKSTAATTDSHAQCPVSTDQKATLPEGHPALPEGHPALPDGHPALPGGMDVMNSNEPVNGSLAIKVTQGTKDGPSLAGEKVTVRLYSQGNVVDQREAAISPDGMAMIEDLKLTGVVQPVVSIEHSGVTFQQVGKPMGAMMSDQLIRLPVYETTDQQPDWNVAMCHVIVRRIDGGIAVTQMLAVQNPADRAWIGSPTKLEEDTANVTFSMPMPANAQHVSVDQGFADDSARLEHNVLIHTGPITPGMTRYQISYLVPAVDGKVDLKVTAPAAVGHLMVFVPDDGSDVTVTGLNEGQAMGNGEQKVRVFAAENVEADQSVSLNLAVPTTNATTGNKDKDNADAAPVHGAAQSSTAPSGVPKVAVGAGAAVLAVTAAVAAAFRKRTSDAGAKA